LNAWIPAFAAVAALGCATTQVGDESASWGRAPKPGRILVHAFAVTAQEVRLDHGVSAEVWKLQGLTESTERTEVGRKVADVLADELVKKIQALGLPAERASGPPPRDGTPTLVVDGQFLAIGQGSSTERVVIGLGAGKSDVRTAVQVIEILPEGSRTRDTFEVEAKSGSTPGMAETMGAGAAAGHLAASAAVSVGKSVASEKFGDDVEADARRTAEQISKLLAGYFAREGWIAPPEQENR
jgi:hypothetical protein